MPELDIILILEFLGALQYKSYSLENPILKMCNTK